MTDLELACEFLGTWKPGQTCQGGIVETDPRGTDRPSGPWKRRITHKYCQGGPYDGKHDISCPPLTGDLAMRMLRALENLGLAYARYPNAWFEILGPRPASDSYEIIVHVGSEDDDPDDVAEAIVKAVAKLARKTE